MKDEQFEFLWAGVDSTKTRPATSKSQNQSRRIITVTRPPFPSQTFAKSNRRDTFSVSRPTFLDEALQRISCSRAAAFRQRTRGLAEAFQRAHLAAPFRQRLPAALKLDLAVLTGLKRVNQARQPISPVCLAVIRCHLKTSLVRPLNVKLVARSR